MAQMRITPIERQITVATAGLQPAAVAQVLAQVAKGELKKAQSSGQAPYFYNLYVNGRTGVPEERVIPPGPIVYEFLYWEEIIDDALKFVREESPVREGDYQRAWFVMINGRETLDFTNIPFDAEVIVTNDMPYHRKIEMAGMRLRVKSPAIVERARKQLTSIYGNMFRLQRKFINLKGGYRLKQTQAERRGRRAGDEMTYPALVISQKY